MQGRHFVVKGYEPALTQAGIVGAPWHMLRHTFASRASRPGWTFGPFRSYWSFHGHHDHAVRPSLPGSLRGGRR